MIDENKAEVPVEQMEPYSEGKKEAPIIQSTASQDVKMEIESNIQDLPMYVSNPVVKEGIKNFVVYTVSGKYVQEPVSRRFSDFFALRMKLTERWPGVYIPNIPPKKAVGNLESKIIDMRLRLINKFCEKLSKFRDIFNSDELRLFLSNTPDVTKTLNSLLPQTYEELLIKYRRAFPDYYEAYDLAPAKAKLNEFYLFLKKALINLRSFKEVVLSTMTKKEQEIENYLCLINVFSDYEKYTLLEYSDRDDSKLVFFNPVNSELCMKLLKLKEGLENPYVQLHDWLQEEEIDIEAMLEALTSLNGLNENYEKINQKLAAVDTDLKSLKAGKSSLKSMFSFKSKGQDIENFEKEKILLEANLTDLGLVIKISTFNMEYYLEYFKVEKLAEYYRHLKEFSEIQKENNNRLDDLWNSVAQDKNLQKMINSEKDK